MEFTPVELGILEAEDASKTGEVTLKEFEALGWMLQEIDAGCLSGRLCRSVNSEGVMVVFSSTELLAAWEKWEAQDRKQAAHEARMGY